MPLYEFVNVETGEPAEVFFERMEGRKGPPSIGEMIPGSKLRRVASMPVKPVVREICFKAYSQRPYASGAPHYDKDGVGETGGELIDYDASPGEGDRESWKRTGGRSLRPRKKFQMPESS